MEKQAFNLCQGWLRHTGAATTGCSGSALYVGELNHHQTSEQIYSRYFHFAKYYFKYLIQTAQTRHDTRFTILPSSATHGCMAKEVAGWLFFPAFRFF